jgi:hypothetical protein
VAVVAIALVGRREAIEVGLDLGECRDRATVIFVDGTAASRAAWSWSFYAGVLGTEGMVLRS